MICPICQSELVNVLGKLECPLCTQVNSIRKNRKQWKINPQTKVKESKREYNRAEEKRRIQRELEDI